HRRYLQSLPTRRSSDLQRTETARGQRQPLGVRGVWLRHDLETHYKRLMRLEVHARETTHVLERSHQGYRLKDRTPNQALRDATRDRKSTRLNSSHVKIS